MTEFRYLLTFDRLLPVGIVGLILTAAGRHIEPEPLLLIEDGRLSVVQALAVKPSAADTAGDGPSLPATPAPSDEAHLSLVPNASVPPLAPLAAGTEAPVVSPVVVLSDDASSTCATEVASTLGPGEGEAVDPGRRCEGCGDLLPPPRGPGRPRRFCPTCKLERKADIDRDSARRRRAREAAERDAHPVAAEVPLPAVETLPALPAVETLPAPFERLPNPLHTGPQHACDHCPARFVSKKALGLHRAALHPIMGRPA